MNYFKTSRPTVMGIRQDCCLPTGFVLGMARSISPFRLLFTLTLTVIFQGMFLLAQAQPNSQTPSSKSKTPNKRFTLKIQEGELVGVSLKADKARLSDIGAELARVLKTQVVLGPNMEKEAITGSDAARAARLYRLRNAIRRTTKSARDFPI
jgi:hypothetical protein